MSPRKPDDLEAGPTVLIIDDDEAVRSSLEMLLEAYGFQVVLARDGRQGLAAFRANAPDVVLIDLMMPMQDGLETIALSRRDWPKVRIVAMSGGTGIGHWDGLAAARKNWWLLCLGGAAAGASEKALLHTTDRGRTWTVISQVTSLTTPPPPGARPTSG